MDYPGLSRDSDKVSPVSNRASEVCYGASETEFKADQQAPDETFVSHHHLKKDPCHNAYKKTFTSEFPIFWQMVLKQLASDTA